MMPLKPLTVLLTLKYISYMDAIGVMKMLAIDDPTYKRLSSLMSEMMHTKGHDVDYGDVINELINVYQDSMAFSGENAGG